MPSELPLRSDSVLRSISRSFTLFRRPSAYSLGWEGRIPIVASITALDTTLATPPIRPR